MDGIQCVGGRKLPKAFLSTTHRISLKSSLCNSPGKALQEGVRSVAIQPPIPDISGGTNRQTDRHTYTPVHERVGFLLGNQLLVLFRQLLILCKISVTRSRIEYLYIAHSHEKQ